MTVYNFSAGPAMLPKPVLTQIKEDIPSFKNSGMSVMEISHRSALFDNVIADAENDLRELMHIPDNYKILFLQGGATLQFTAMPMNLATQYNHIGLIDTGHWSTRAGEEAEKIGTEVTIVATSKDNEYHQLPEYKDDDNRYDYIHLTTNNTIEGTAFDKLPETKHILVGDMSSNFLAQQYNVTDFGAIYAGAQKNLGIAGLTVVIVREDLIGKKSLPSMLDYRLLANKNSMLNTPPVFAIYAAGLTLKWLKNIGGITEMEKINRQKSNQLYQFLDQSKMFNNLIKPADRSLTNIPFVTGNKALDQEFIAQAADRGLVNLKGHRLVGGMRASLYNAMPIEGVTALTDFLEEFEMKHREEN
ncbi:3-phosphoserine/phosphohydroxythreonine transaminase [Companilactobacillus jidongensis]|uniref:3-phosphoserine/phosphohydroxythreonine transaminase n=1 Tax=Companilactobacillus jidongensis TaxID=2486006 RepID=UPI000F769252|nr:3-phosphoserine/phosphohydroxythreonine transaminase [Companilactobacillus jidongensis]